MTTERPNLPTPTRTLRLARLIVRRRRLSHAVWLLERSLVVAGLAALVLVVVARGLGDAAWATPAVAGLVIVSALAAAVWALSRRRSTESAAAEADAHAGLRDALVSAVLLSRGKPSEDPGFSALAVSRAESVASQIKPTEVVPVRLGRGSIVGPLVVAVAVAAAALLPPWGRQPIAQEASVVRTDPQQVEQARQGIEGLAEALEQQAAEAGLDEQDEASDRVQRELERLREIEDELAQGSRDPQEAMTEAAAAATEAAEAIEDDARRRELADEALRDALSRLEQTADAERLAEDSLRGAAERLADAMERGDLERAAEAAEELRERSEDAGVTEEERREAAERLRDMAERLDQQAGRAEPTPPATEQQDPATPQDPRQSQTPQPEQSPEQEPQDPGDSSAPQPEDRDAQPGERDQGINDQQSDAQQEPARDEQSGDRERSEQQDQTGSEANSEEQQREQARRDAQDQQQRLSESIREQADEIEQQPGESQEQPQEGQEQSQEQGQPEPGQGERQGAQDQREQAGEPSESGQRESGQTEPRQAEPGGEQPGEQPQQPSQEPSQSEQGQSEPGQQEPGQQEQTSRELTPGASSDPSQTGDQASEQRPGEQPGEQSGEQAQEQEGEQEGREHGESQGDQRQGLSERLRDLADRPRDAQRQQQQAEDLRRRAREAFDNMSPEEQQELLDRLREQGRQDPEGQEGMAPGGEPGDEQGGPGEELVPDDDRRPGEGPDDVDPWQRELMDMTRSEAGQDEAMRTVAEWFGEGRDVPGDGSSPAAQDVQRAARGAQDAIERERVPRRRSELIRKVFQRYAERFGQQAPTPAGESSGGGGS
ncbi:MAG: hypothetical protein RIE77_08615 [Phycisphaerales bacterium]|jgi:hypothetical protein